VKASDAAASVGVRVDKWLWAARFFKTRQLAVDAIERERVEVNGNTAKASKELRGGEMLRVRVGEQLFEIEVLAVSDRRGSATVARLLYRETPEGAKARMDALERRRLQPEPAQQLHGRPTKRDRRELQQMKERS
jgi:ribosome-associated heat shock protein Hsp15